MVNQIHLLLLILILVLFLVLCTGVLRTPEGFEDTANYIKNMNRKMEVPNKTLSNEIPNNVSILKTLNKVSSFDDILKWVPALDKSNTRIASAYNLILKDMGSITEKLEKDASVALAAADVAPTDTKVTAALAQATKDVLDYDKNYAKAAADAFTAATNAVESSKVALDKSTANLSATRAILDAANKAYSTQNAVVVNANAALAKASATFNALIDNYEKSSKALDAITKISSDLGLELYKYNNSANKDPKKGKQLNDAYTTATVNSKAANEKFSKDNKPYFDAYKDMANQRTVAQKATTALQAANVSMIRAESSYNKAVALLDGARASYAMARGAAITAKSLADTLANSVKSKKDSADKAALAIAAKAAAATAAAAAAQDPSKKAAAKSAADAAVKAKADADLASALSKKAADDKVKAAEESKQKTEAAAKENAAMNATTAAKLAAANAEAQAAANAIAKEAAKKAQDAKEESEKKAKEAEAMMKKLAKARAESANASPETKELALQKLAILEEKTQAARKDAKSAKEALMDAKSSSKDLKQNVGDVKKDKPFESPMPNKKEVNQINSRKPEGRPIIINNIMPQVQPPVADNSQNILLSSAAGSFIGAGFGSLLGTSVGLALHDANHRTPAISAPPNSKNMGRYMDQPDTEWTRGGPPLSRRYDDPYNYITEVNEDDPEAVRWPGKTIEPSNLYGVEAEKRNRPRHKHHLGHHHHSSDYSKNDEDDCKPLCEPSVPLKRSFNTERDYSSQ